MNEHPIWLRGSSLRVESGAERAIALAYDFVRAGVPQRAYRWTGGCGLTSTENRIALEILREGVFRAGELAYGHHIQGGTRMRGYLRPEVVIPGVIEIPVQLKQLLGEKMCLYGITPLTDEGTISDDYGTILTRKPDADHPYGGHFTTLRGDIDVTVFFQPSANEKSKYEDEVKRAYEIIDHLIMRAWQSLLISFNGGGVTKKEVIHWCRQLATSEEWQQRASILLIKGSGRETDVLAADEEFLDQNPWVTVATLDPDHIAECIRKVFRLEA